MQFSDITKAVHDVWTFSWPPIVLLLVIYFVSKYLNSDGTRESLGWLSETAKFYGGRLNELKDILEPYGLTKLIPVISAIAVIGMFYLLNGPVTIVASNLPPHISYSPDIALERSMSEEEKLVLLRKFPTADHFNSAYYMALNSYKPSEEPKSGRADLNHKIDNFIKFAALTTIILFFINIKFGSPIFSQLGKSLLLITILIPIWGINFTILLKKQEQQFFDEWNTVRVELLKDSKKLIELDASEEETNIINQFRENREKRWWRIYFFDPHFIPWFKYTFFPGKMR